MILHAVDAMDVCVHSADDSATLGKKFLAASGIERWAPLFGCEYDVIERAGVGGHWRPHWVAPLPGCGDVGDLEPGIALRDDTGLSKCDPCRGRVRGTRRSAEQFEGARATKGGSESIQLRALPEWISGDATALACERPLGSWRMGGALAAWRCVDKTKKTPGGKFPPGAVEVYEVSWIRVWPEAESSGSQHPGRREGTASWG